MDARCGSEVRGTTVGGSEFLNCAMYRCSPTDVVMASSAAMKEGIMNLLRFFDCEDEVHPSPMEIGQDGFELVRAAAADLPTCRPADLPTCRSFRH
jgi:hypothetical protein